MMVWKGQNMTERIEGSILTRFDVQVYHASIVDVFKP
jgi:hypothetical protein